MFIGLVVAEIWRRVSWHHGKTRKSALFTYKFSVQIDATGSGQDSSAYGHIYILRKIYNILLLKGIGFSSFWNFRLQIVVLRFFWSWPVWPVFGVKTHFHQDFCLGTVPLTLWGAFTPKTFLNHSKLHRKTFDQY